MLLPLRVGGGTSKHRLYTGRRSGGRNLSSFGGQGLIPNIDFLINEGIALDRAYVTSSVYAQSLLILTGAYASSTESCVHAA